MNSQIRVKEICGEYCIDENDVKQLSKVIIENIHEQNAVELDFEGVDTVLTAFFNGLVGELFQHFDFQTIKKTISFSESSQANLAEKFRKSLYNAKNFYEAPREVQIQVKEKINRYFTEIDVNELATDS